MAIKVAHWLASEVLALRTACRMSKRDFADRLGVTHRTVTNWENGETIAPFSQRLLDGQLAKADSDVTERFIETLTGTAGGVANLMGLEQPGLPDGVEHAALGDSSAARTRTLLDAMRDPAKDTLPYAAPAGADETMAGFLQTPSRVFVISGRPGCGKSALIRHLASTHTTEADWQIHSLDTLDTSPRALAAAILRYATLPSGPDPLLAVEAASRSLSGPCVVAIDGINSQDQLDDVAKHVELTLRQVTDDRLRFVLVIRTPPDIELSAYPILSASFHRVADEPETSYVVAPWTPNEAAKVWNGSKGVSDPAYADLPQPIQSLVQLPLYMRLLRTAGHQIPLADTSPYRLVDQCVRAILRATGHSVEETLEELAALACREASNLIPAKVLGSGTAGVPPAEGQRGAAGPVLPLTHTSATGRTTFDHDALREYMVATQIGAWMADRGRSVATVAALNELAAQAATSASARGVLEFVVDHLDWHAPSLATSIALSPTISATTTLPLVLAIGSRGAAFVTDEVVRACARRSIQDTRLELARSLLAMPTIVTALQADYAPWVISLLQRFGSAIWPDLVTSIEQTLDAIEAQNLIGLADLDNADQAAFFARHFFLFNGDGKEQSAAIDGLIGHPDWRVRAALADGARDPSAPRDQLSETIMDRLVVDHDYKVRAAAATSVSQVGIGNTGDRLFALLQDENWHVRERLLEGLTATPDPDSHSTLLNSAVSAITTEEAWRRAPAHIKKLVERVLIEANSTTTIDSDARQQALFSVMRELRTGAVQIPRSVEEAIVAEARGSSRWLVSREAEAFAAQGRGPGRQPSVFDPTSSREAFRRLRGRRSVQIALDLHDISDALAVAAAVAGAGVDLIEVGDPLIKRVGLQAIERIKHEAPETAVVAEMMSADWGRDQVLLAAEAGADIVLLIGPATTASVAAAADAGRRLGIPIILDVPASQHRAEWIRDMERAGIDGLAITTNIDLGIGGRQPLQRASQLRGWTRLPIAVSGGFGTAETTITEGRQWDILVVGRSVTEAINPRRAARELVKLVHG